MFQFKNNIPYIEFINNAQCIAGVSTRKGGVSTGNYASLNLGLNTNDSLENVMENRRRFFDAIAPQCSVAYLTQTHSDTIHQVDATFKNGYEGDAFFTREKNILLSITTADCGAVVLVDNNYSIAAAIHCGWRGLRAQIVEKTIQKMSAFVNPNNLKAYIAPSIGQENYEVGKEFLDFFSEQYITYKNGRYFFNIYQHIAQSLNNAGLVEINVCKFNTFSQADDFFSYRRDKNTGRFSTFVGLIY